MLATDRANSRLKLNAGLLVDARRSYSFAIETAIAIKTDLTVHHPTRRRDFAAGK